jgi:hypothetical protein
MLDKKRKLLIGDFKSNNNVLENDEIRELKNIVNKLIYIQIYLETIAFSEKSIVTEYKNIEKINNDEKNKYVSITMTDKIDSYRNIMEVIDDLIQQTSTKYKISKLIKIKNILWYIMYSEDLIDITDLTESNFQNDVLHKQIKDISNSIDYLKHILDLKANKIFDVKRLINEVRSYNSSLISRKHKIFRNEILCFKSEFAPVKHQKKIDDILKIFDKILINYHRKPA